MCLAIAYIEKDGQEQEVMRDVAWIRPEKDEVQLTTLLGESSLFRGKIKSIDLLNSVVVLESPTADQP